MHIFSRHGAVGERVTGLVESRVNVVMHEIRQPLAAVLALAELARSGPDVPPDVRRCLDLLVEQAHEVCGAATSASGTDPGPDQEGAATVDLGEVIDSAMGSIRFTWSGLLVRRGARGPLPIAGLRPTVRRCLVNLLDNATRAAGPGGTVSVIVDRDAETVHVMVDDDGPGFGSVPRHTGLGLATTRSALEALGGALLVGRPPDGRGARVGFSLPLLASRLDSPPSTRKYADLTAN
jgi:signal transduction histidine kinase